MIKKIFTILCLSAFAVTGFAQQDAQFSQNMFNRLSTNAGYAGSSGAICGTSLIRQQWGGFISGSTGIPKTGLISIDAPVKLAGTSGGAGLTVLSDALGNEKTFYVKGAYAYRQSIGPGTLGAGLELGAINKTLNDKWVSIDANDATIPQGAQATKFDMGLGLYYSIPNMFYAGISTTHLTAPTVNKTDFSYLMRRHYYITSGYEYNIDPKISLRPSVFIKTDGRAWQWDVNCNIFYNNMVWAGLTYRHKDAIPVMVGYQGTAGKGNYKIGYSYDVTTSSIKRQGRSVNTHEIMFGYCYVIPPKVNITHYKNVRFL